MEIEIEIEILVNHVNLHQRIKMRTSKGLLSPFGVIMHSTGSAMPEAKSKVNAVLKEQL
jgi:hypothetical protein